VKEYFEGVKKRAGLIILFGQMCIIMFQLSTLNEKSIIVCEQHYHQIICIEQ